MLSFRVGRRVANIFFIKANTTLASASHLTCGEARTFLRQASNQVIIEHRTLHSL